MITIELTETQIEHLNQGADQFGRCSLLLDSKEGDAVFVVVSKTTRRGRPRMSAAELARRAGETATEASPS